MIAEAIHTATAIGWAIVAWIVLTSAAACLALYAVVVTVATPIRAACRALTAALAAWRALTALAEHPDRYKPRQRPLWAAA
ncbi:hypothetical protein OG819_42815 [Streptomyces sp. NBC_01549]|uniref:hypothetical protein n=1 Tax=Streptomyces sp. NBC_01549 TaxID=2975874 RepID=UPI002251A2D2|nr:hypothetical protein [Streptomyces sp. NBC_01549]MCX4596150.1 hypothetical protein [Streptomyces sp. NBC_01549]